MTNDTVPPPTGRATLADYVAYLRAREAAREARRRERLEARPDRLAKLKAAAEKRARRRGRNLVEVAQRSGALIPWDAVKASRGL